MSKLSVLFDMEVSPGVSAVFLTGTDTVKVVPLLFGWSFQPSYGEWELIIQYTTRQDGKTFWAVVLTEVDSRVQIQSGEAVSGDPALESMCKAIVAITDHWITPITAAFK